MLNRVETLGAMLLISVAAFAGGAFVSGGALDVSTGLIFATFFSTLAKVSGGAVLVSTGLGFGCTLGFNKDSTCSGLSGSGGLGCGGFGAGCG